MKKNAPVEPVLYQIGRPGHGALNLTEYMYAFDMLMNWIETKERPQDEECFMIEVEPERSAVLDERGVNFSVAKIDRSYGDIDLDLHALGKSRQRTRSARPQWLTFLTLDLEELGYRPGNYIPFHTPNKGTVNVLYSYYPFAGVEHGAWVAATDAYGKVSVWRHVTHTSIEYRYANKDLGVEEGDKIFVPKRAVTRTRVM